MSSSEETKRGAWLRRAVAVGGLFTALGVGISYAGRAQAAGIPTYSAPGVTTVWHALILLNDIEVAGSVANIVGYAATPQASYFGTLKGGDKLTCLALHYAVAPQLLWGAKNRTYFSGYRVSGL